MRPAVPVLVHTFHATHRVSAPAEPPPQRLPVAAQAVPLPQTTASAAPVEAAAAPAVAAATPASTPEPAVAHTADPGALAAWESQVVAKLEREKRYPDAARMRNQEGIVSLRVTVDVAGRVTAFRIERSSGSDALDREAVSLIGRVQPLPPPPSDANPPVQFVVPIVFALRSAS